MKFCEPLVRTAPLCKCTRRARMHFLTRLDVRYRSEILFNHNSAADASHLHVFCSFEWVSFIFCVSLTLTLWFARICFLILIHQTLWFSLVRMLYMLLALLSFFSYMSEHFGENSYVHCCCCCLHVNNKIGYLPSFSIKNLSHSHGGFTLHTYIFHWILFHFCHCMCVLVRALMCVCVAYFQCVRIW